MNHIDTLINKFAYILGPENVLENEALSKHTSFKIGGPAAVLLTPTQEEDIVAVQELCRKAGVELRVIGLGSNILVSDAGLPCVVMELSENFSEIRIEGCEVIAQAGASNELVAHAALSAGLSGYEFASGIPGTIGGAAIMNAGAYDGEFKDVCVQVRYLNPAGEIVELSADEAAWGYRHSFMMDDGGIVLGARLRLQRGQRSAIQARMDELKARRAEKQPLEMPSAGSTFKRPEGHFAGKLIQDAGLRGYRVGGAQISEKHCGFVVNAENASAADVLQLIADVQEKVYAHAGVRMEPEVRMWGF